MTQFFAGYRTYIVAAAMLVAGLAQMLGVTLPSFAGAAPGDLVLQALAIIFLRQGVKSAAKPQ